MINYKKAGYNTLNEMFDAMLKKQAEGDHVGFIKMSSLLTSNQKVSFIEHSKGHKVFAGAMKDLVTESCGDYRVGKDYAEYIKMSLAKGGYIVTPKPEDGCCCGDNWTYPEVYFTDGQLIEGYVALFQKEVHLKAVDAKERIYNKSITYLDETDLIDSIDHFKHDIEETFNEVSTPEISADASIETKADYTGEDGIRELVLFIENDARTYAHIQDVLLNLAKKINKGVYNPELAIKSWDAIAAQGIKDYNSEFKNNPIKISKQDRLVAAKQLQESFEEELQAYTQDPRAMAKSVSYTEPVEDEPVLEDKTSSVDSSNDVNTLAQYLQVEPTDVTTEDGENYSVNGKTEKYKVRDTALDLAEQGYQNAMYDNKYIYWK